MSDITPRKLKEKVQECGGFESISFSPHMRFRAGQRRLNWDKIKNTIRNGDIEKVEINHKPNESIPFEKAYIIFLSIEGDTIIVPLYILENQSMKAVTVMRK